MSNPQVYVQGKLYQIQLSIPKRLRDCKHCDFFIHNAPLGVCCRHPDYVFGYGCPARKLTPRHEWAPYLRIPEPEEQNI